MTTPRKTFNYNSPYAQPVKPYPSQSEDYISLDMGGAKQQYSGACSNEQTPRHSNLKYYQQDLRHSNSKANRKNLFNNKYGQQNHRQNFNQQSFGSRNSSEWSHQQNIRNSNDKRFQQQKNFHKDKQDIKPIASYIHPSMTEDPWFELTQRLRALEKSEISIKTESQPIDRTPTANSDEEIESASGD